MSGRYLEAWLAPLLPMLRRPEVTDVFINRPGEAWVEAVGGALERVEVRELTEERLWRLARQIASVSHQGISREHPLLAATMPDGARVQVVAPPAARGGLAFAIRKQVAPDRGLADYLGAGAFGETRFAQGYGERAAPPPPGSGEPGELAAYLARMVRERRNILISGGTSSGKTTFLNALIREIPKEQRLITIEDTPELVVEQPNAVSLIAVRGGQGEAQVGMDDLLAASLRMRPDRIILGELRGGEAYTFLRAVNTGHPGSLSTIHADSPEGAVEQLALIILQSGVSLRREDIVHYVEQVVDVIVQLDRVGGVRRVAQIMATRGA
jgi:type IV secretion system protein VirB11